MIVVNAAVLAEMAALAVPLVVLAEMAVPLVVVPVGVAVLPDDVAVGHWVKQDEQGPASQ